MILTTSIHLFVCVMTLSLGFSISMHSIPNEYIHHKLFSDSPFPLPYSRMSFIVPQEQRSGTQEYDARASESFVSAQELTTSAQETFSSSQKTLPKAKEESTLIRKFLDDYQQSTKRSQQPLVNFQKLTSSLRGNINCSNAHNVSQKSPFSSIADPQQSPFSSISDPQQSPFSSIADPQQSPISSIADPQESPFSSISDPQESPFSSISDPQESSFSSISDLQESPFSSISDPQESPFSSIADPQESPFSSISDPQESLFSSIVDPQESPFSSIADPQQSHFSSIADPKESPSLRYTDHNNEYTSAHILQRVKRHQRWRRSGGGGGGGGGTRFCNQFGCQSNSTPVRTSSNSRCPPGSRFDRRSNRCRWLRRG